MTNDFEIASAVASLLKDLEKEKQTRILRWVAESIGVVIAADARTSEDVKLRDSGAGLNLNSPPGSSTDIKSFVALKDPKSDNQFAATVAYYYRFEAPANLRSDSISSEALQEATRLAGRNRLGDPGKTLRNAKDQGYLDLAERGSYKINTVGENLVAMTLPGQGRATPTKAPKKKVPVKKGKR